MIQRQLTQCNKTPNNCTSTHHFYFTESVKFLDVQSLKNVISNADQELAEDLQLPLSFFLYKSKPKCKGCVGCEQDSETVRLNTK